MAELSSDELHVLLFGGNVRKYLLVDCPVCGSTGTFRNISADERNEFIHGSAKLIPQVVDVFQQLGRTILNANPLKAAIDGAALVLKGLQSEPENFMRFMRCTSCTGIVLICPHCSRLFHNRVYREKREGFELNCPSCGGTMDT